MSMSIRDIREGCEYIGIYNIVRMVLSISNAHLGGKATVKYMAKGKKGECSLATFARWADREWTKSEN